MHITAIINKISKNPCTKHCKNRESDIKPMQIATKVDSFSKNPCEIQCSIPGEGGEGEGDGEGEGEGEGGKLSSRMPSDRMNTPLTQTRSFASPARTHERNETNTISWLGDVQRKTHKPQTSDKHTHNTHSHTHTQLRLARSHARTKRS